MKVAAVVASAGLAALVVVVGACAGPGPHSSPSPPPAPEASPEPGSAGAEATPAPPTPPDPSSKAGIVCAGHEQIRLEGKVIDAAGAAVSASGYCEVTIVHGKLSGATIGIHASEDAHVVVEDSHVRGGQQAIVAADRAVVECKNSEWLGRIQAEGKGRIVDRGDNVWTR